MADGLDGAARCAAVDAWLAQVFAAAQPPAGTALVAVGGHGRGWLAPGSDLDLVLLHDRRAKGVEALAAAVWHPIWDAGFPVDHSVRTVDGCLSAAHDDLKVALGLLDARRVAGDGDLVASLVRRLDERWRGHAKTYLPRLAAATAGRHGDPADRVDAAHRAVAFAQEPDLKAGRGGLRDLDALRAARRAGAPCPAPCPSHGDAGDGGTADDRALADAEATLRSVRSALHLEAGVGRGRLAADVLRADLRAGVAVRLGCDEPELDLRLAAAARRVDWSSARAWPRIESWLDGPGSLWRASGDAPLAADLVRRDGHVRLAPGADPADPALALRAAALAAETGLALGDDLLATLVAIPAPVPDGPWPAALRRAFVDLLSTGPGVVEAVEALDHVGLFAAYLPEWDAVRSRHQRNPFHTWTVDRHLLEVVSVAGTLVRRVARADLLVVAALLHDLGKGVPERDHTEAGVELVHRVGARMGFEADDIDTVATLVGLHLLLPDTATRRDPDDPAIVAGVAEVVGSVERLELLHALVEADARATGPTAWTPWRAGLVARLVERVEAHLAQGDAPAGAAGVGHAAQRKVLDAEAAAGLVGAPVDAVAVTETAGGTLQVVVSAVDRAGLVALVAGAVAVAGFTVLAADLGPGAGDGRAAQVLAVERGPGAGDADALRTTVEAALAGRLALAQKLADRTRAYARRRAAPPAPPEVVVEPRRLGATGATTWIEVRAADTPGLLHALAGALAGLGVDVRSARCATIGHQAVDAFEVAAAGGHPLDDARLDAVRAALLAAALG